MNVLVLVTPKSGYCRNIIINSFVSGTLLPIRVIEFRNEDREGVLLSPCIHERYKQFYGPKEKNFK